MSCLLTRTVIVLHATIIRLPSADRNCLGGGNGARALGQGSGDARGGRNLGGRRDQCGGDLGGGGRRGRAGGASVVARALLGDLAGLVAAVGRPRGEASGRRHGALGECGAEGRGGSLVGADVAGAGIAVRVGTAEDSREDGEEGVAVHLGYWAGWRGSACAGA